MCKRVCSKSWNLFVFYLLYVHLNIKLWWKQSYYQKQHSCLQLNMGVNLAKVSVVPSAFFAPADPFIIEEIFWILNNLTSRHIHTEFVVIAFLVLCFLWQFEAALANESGKCIPYKVPTYRSWDKSSERRKGFPLYWQGTHTNVWLSTIILLVFPEK